MKITYFVCTVNSDRYEHQEYETWLPAKAAAGKDSWIIAVSGAAIVDAKLDTPGIAIRAVTRVLKWRTS